MNKVYLVLVIMLILSSCKSKVGSINNEEILIVHKALMISNPNHTEINVIAEPNNNSVINFKDGGFDDDEYNIYTNKFYFKKNRITTWDKSIALGNNIIKDKITIIESYNKIEKVTNNELKKSKTIISISNVMFSDDGKLAILNIITSSNLVNGGGWGQIYVFKKVDNEWRYMFEFMNIIS